MIQLIGSNKIMKIGVGIKADLKKISRKFDSKLEDPCYFDIRFAAQHAYFKPLGLASLVAQTLNRQLSKYSTQ